MSSVSVDNNGIHSPRIRRLVDAFHSYQIDCLLVSSGSNRLYLSGFTGSSGTLLVARERNVLVTDGRYRIQATAQAMDYECVVHKGALLDQLIESVLAAGVKKLGFDPVQTSVRDFEILSGGLKDRCQLVAAPGLVEDLRTLKDHSEVDVLRRAIAIGDLVMGMAGEAIRPGVREIDVAQLIERELRVAGASGPSFPVIVAAGRNGAMPHHSPTETVIQDGDSVVVDMGAKLDGYCSDMTRTFSVGGPTPMFEKIYEIVLAAQGAAIQGVCDGVDARQCDALAREVISSAGYGESFGHGTGHGVGIDIHEAPRVSANSEDLLRAGMVHSVEPGIYLPEWGGVRIEDLVLVTETGSEVLSQHPK